MDTRSNGEVRPGEDLLLDVQDLKTWFYTRDGVIKAVDGVSLQLRRGEILGVVGESGSGQDESRGWVRRLVGARRWSPAERMRCDRHRLLRASRQHLRSLRGDQLAMICQHLMMALNPSQRLDTDM